MSAHRGKNSANGEPSWPRHQRQMAVFERGRLRGGVEMRGAPLVLPKRTHAHSYEHIHPHWVTMEVNKWALLPDAARLCGYEAQVGQHGDGGHWSGACADWRSVFLLQSSKG